MKRYLSLCLILLAVPAHAQAPRPPAVEVRAAELRELAPAINAAGQVQSRAAADLAAGVAGRIAWVAEPGAVVDAGAPVARIDTTELKLARAEQAARVTRAQVNLDSLEREVERQRAGGPAVSRYALEQAQANRDLARADLATARAVLAQTDEQLARAELQAPFSGVVSERLHRVGEEVGRGEVLARLLNPDDLEIRLFVPLRHVRAVQPGQAVRVIGERQVFEAAVRAVVPAGDPRSQSFEVLVAPPAVDGLVTPGQLVRVELPLGQPAQHLAVPRDALVIRADGIFVYRVTAERKAERIPVQPGVADGDWIAVDGALAAGDRIVIRGGESLRGGETVNIVGEFIQ